MKWGTILGVTILVALITLYEWPKINFDQKKEKITYITLIAVGWLLAILLIFFPDMPGPAELVNMIYKPLGKILEK